MPPGKRKQLNQVRRNSTSWRRESLNVTAAEAAPGQTGVAEAAKTPNPREPAETAANPIFLWKRSVHLG